MEVDQDIALMLRRLMTNPMDTSSWAQPQIWTRILQRCSTLLREKDIRLRHYHDTAASLARALHDLHLQDD